MDDQELTKWAAKAAGLWDAENDCVDIPWLPLVNDGDALRLAVKLRLDTHYETQFLGDETIDIVEIFYDCDPVEGGCKCEMESLGADPAAATRRAIVRAAATIGQAMESGNG